MNDFKPSILQINKKNNEFLKQFIFIYNKDILNKTLFELYQFEIKNLSWLIGCADSMQKPTYNLEEINDLPISDMSHNLKTKDTLINIYNTFKTFYDKYKNAENLLIKLIKDINEENINNITLYKELEEFMTIDTELNYINHTDLKIKQVSKCFKCPFFVTQLGDYVETKYICNLAVFKNLQQRIVKLGNVEDITTIETPTWCPLNEESLLLCK
jgi:hypothetical protein